MHPFFFGELGFGDESVHVLDQQGHYLAHTGIRGFGKAAHGSFGDG